MNPFIRDEPSGRHGYVRPGLVLLVIPFLWLVIALRLLDALPGQSVLSFVIVGVPCLLAVFAFVSLSMRRLLDLGAPNALAWLALLPGAALPLYIVLAIAPTPARASTDVR